MPNLSPLSRRDIAGKTTLSQWDILAFLLVFASLFLVVTASLHADLPYQLGQKLSIELNPSVLPRYALYSTFRMLIALFFSLLFALAFGTLAAKNATAERIILPLVDVLQAVPILGFLPMGVWGFMALFPGRMLGPESAAIFAIFTSQAWNIMLSFYQSLSTLPKDFLEACQMSQLTTWQIFWRLELPYALPGLLWNIMLSLSAGWFFVVAAEAISISNHTIFLPGIGSYIAVAIEQGDIAAIGYAMFAMLLVILTYDQCLLRPITYWVSGHQAYGTSLPIKKPLMSMLLSRARWFRACITAIRRQIQEASAFCKRLLPSKTHPTSYFTLAVKAKKFGMILILLAACSSLFLMQHDFIPLKTSLPEIDEIKKIFFMGLITSIRVMLLVIFCLLLWTPIGVWIGLRPRIAQRLQPFVQFLAALPVNLFYPLIFMMIIRYHLNVEIWTAPLMVLGMQWYVLFNVIAGASQLSLEQRQAVESFGLNAKQKWQYFIIPGIAAELITAAITAAGGAWNASIIAEVVQWRSVEIKATGLGAYIATAASKGQFSQLTIAVMIMCVYVLAFNRILWQPLYQKVKSHYA
jgi:NitT/TauT family transport system permease protein